MSSRLLLIVATAVLTACASPSIAPVVTSPTPSASASPTSGGAWQTDFDRLADGVSMDQFVRAVASTDAIPALRHPAVVAASRVDWLAEDEPVIAVERNGQWRAYPLQIMLWHEIVNDVLGDEPIVVTFCPLCHTSVAFDPRLDGVTLDFGVSGYLRRSDLVMYDVQTETWWQQATGIGLVGTHAGHHLEFLPSSVVAWSEFRDAHPEATVVGRETGYDREYGRNPYPGWDRVERIPFFKKGELLFCDGDEGCLDAKERVAVVRANGETVVFPFRHVASAGGLVETEVGGVPVAVWWRPAVRTVLNNALIERADQVGTVVAFDRRLADDVLSFEQVNGTLVDDQTATAWNALGEGSTGKLAGERLARLVVDTPYWFGFAAFGHDFATWPPEE